MVNPNEEKARSLRAAINERAERLRRFEAGSHMPADERLEYAAIKRQIRDIEIELSEIPL